MGLCCPSSRKQDKYISDPELLKLDTNEIDDENYS